MIEANGHDWRGEPRPTRREAPHAYPRRQRTGFSDYQQQITRQQGAYHRAAQNTGAPVVVGTQYVLCIFN